MAKVVVLGGAGFIGRNLVNQLVKIYDTVCTLDREPFPGPAAHEIRHTSVDLSNQETWLSKELTDILDGAQAVINLCGKTSHLESMERPLDDLEDNLIPQICLLEKLKSLRSEAALVFASTRQVYGHVSMNPVNESHPTRPVDTNGIHKVAAEEYSRIYAELLGFRVTNLRLSNVYGPGMDIESTSKMFLGQWIKSASEGRSIKIYGDGTLVRDLVFVGDVVDAIIKSLKQSDAGLRTFNIGGPLPMTLLEIANLIQTEFPESSVSMVPMPKELFQIAVGDFWTDNSAAEEVLDWRPATSFSQGLPLTLASLTIR